MHQAVRALHEGDLTSFERLLRREAWLLGESCVAFQVGLIERATLRDSPGSRTEWQPILDHALAWAVLNRHLDIAAFLLEHGADSNTRWSSHEPASLLHELVFRDDYEGMQFLVDHGIDMTIRDYRWDATAEGWARYGAMDLVVDPKARELVPNPAHPDEPGAPD